MKKRKGFVSNSSSASFVICLYELRQCDLDRILTNARNNCWSIDVEHGLVKGFTSMDNYNKTEWINFLKSIHVEPSLMEYS